MATLQELIGPTTSPADQNNKVGTFESVLAGIGSGLLGIPKGLFSLGATLMDLGVNSGKAAEVEQWFDDLTSWDEKAEATTAGKLAEVLVNIGVPGGVAFRHGTKMANAAMQASKSGKYLDLDNPIIKKGMADTYKLTSRGKTKKFMTGALLGGAAEGVFIGDVEDVGSLGDLLGGPTEIDRGEGEDAFRDLLNRVKFGTEGALFTGILGGTGATIRKLRNRNNELDIANSKMDRWIDKVGSWFRSRSGWTPEAFAAMRLSKGLAGGDARVAKSISRDIDQSIDAIFPRMKTMMDNSPTSKARTAFMADVNDALLSGEARISDELLDAKGLRATDAGFNKETAIQGRVEWTAMDKDKLAKVVRKMDELGAKPEDIDKVRAGLSVIRKKWGDLFTELGKTLNADELAEFKALFGNKFKNYLGSTYEFMYNKSLIPWFRYKPARELIDRAKQVFIDSAEEAGRKITPMEAEAMVSNVIRSAGMPKGFRLDKPSDALFNIPDFFVNRTTLDDAVTQRGSQRISIGAIAKDTDRKVFEDLLGKHKNPMQTILGGTAKLSMIVRRNVFFKDLMKKNDELIAAGKRPMFVKNEDEALKWFGDNYKRIEVLDPAQTLHVGTGARGVALKKSKDVAKEGARAPTPATGATNPFSDPLNPWFATPGMADALKKTGMEVAEKGMIGQLYHSLLLYPKATSQIAKTILSPVTHMRNFISAGAFATANGIVPFADKEAIKMAYQALQTPLKGTRIQNQLYDELLELGVVNTNVRLGDVTRLMQDVGFGETMNANRGTQMLMKPLAKLKSVGQDLYTAEDDFWKIYSWAVEKSRMEKAMAANGLVRGQWFTNAAGESIQLTDDWFKREAADIVKNNIPNYDFVSDFVKGTRKLPLGNFVSFPAEIARTGTNIVERALRDINYTITLANGKKIKPFQGIGYTRLLGFGATVAAVPYATTEMFKVLYDVTDEEQAAIRRYVADWSKNSTILPIKDPETGEFKYVDFSHANAYDTLVRPVQAVINAVADGRTDNDGIMDDFMKGTFTAMSEFASPFISESIWTEAAMDIIGRQGRTRDGFEVYNENDTPGNKTRAIFKHLVDAQMPFSYPQLKRLFRTIEPVNVITKGKYDEYGQTYEFGDEAAGLFGFRAVQVNPGRTMKFKVADYQQGVRKSGSLFTRVTLKGGPIQPSEITEAYINANRSLFQVKKDLKLDMDAARLLGISEEKYEQAMDRVSNVEQNSIDEGAFRPYRLSAKVEEAFQTHADEMGVANPLDAAYNAISNLEEQFSDLSLDGLFPDVQNPLVPMGLNMPFTTPGGDTGALNLPGVNPQAVTNQGGNVPYNQLTTQQKLDILFGRS